ncbi:MAG: DMT family transporter [Pseudomonadota bacterium]
MKTKVAVLYTIMCLIWGSTWLAMKIGLEDLPPFLFAGVRFAIAFVILGFVLKAQGFSLKLQKNEIWPILILGVFMIALPYGLVFWGQQYTNSAMGATLMCTLPLLIFPISYLMKSDEELNLSKLLGVVIGLSGVFVIFYPKLTGGGTSLKGDLAIFASVFIYSFTTVYLKKYAAHISIKKCVFYQLLVGAPLLIIFGLLVESPHRFIDGLMHWKALVALLYLAVFGSLVTFLIYYWLIRRIGAVASASAIFIEVGLAVFLDWAVMSVIPHAYTWVGMAFIFLGVWLVVVYGKAIKTPGVFEDVSPALIDADTRV